MFEEAPIPALQDAIRHLHGCGSTFVESVPVEEWSESVAVPGTHFASYRVWKGAVCVFDLIGHLQAKRAYAWSRAVPGTDRRRFFVVLHLGPAESPVTAVRSFLAGKHCGTWEA